MRRLPKYVSAVERFECHNTPFLPYREAFFVDKDMREVIKQGKGDYIPISIAQVPNLLKNGGLTIDVALIQVTMPDQHGFVSLGVSNDITHAVIQKG